MDRKTVVITGASDGIGAAAARALVSRGHRVILVGRSPAKTAALAAELGMPFHTADYARLDDVVRLARQLRAYDRVDVLANNAGAVMKQRLITVDGFEQTLQVNFLAPFLLTNLLADRLCACSATVLQTSSIAAVLYGGRFDLQDLNGEKRFDPLHAYGNTKLENVLFTRELVRRFGGRGLHAAAFEPGVVRSNFASEAAPFLRLAYHSPLRYLFTVSPERGARRLVRLAEGVPGRDFEDGAAYRFRRPFRVSLRDPEGTTAALLWDRCAELLSSRLN